MKTLRANSFGTEYYQNSELRSYLFTTKNNNTGLRIMLSETEILNVYFEGQIEASEITKADILDSDFWNYETELTEVILSNSELLSILPYTNYYLSEHAKETKHLFEYMFSQFNENLWKIVRFDDFGREKINSLYFRKKDNEWTIEQYTILDTKERFHCFNPSFNPPQEIVNEVMDENFNFYKTIETLQKAEIKKCLQREIDGDYKEFSHLNLDVIIETAFPSEWFPVELDYSYKKAKVFTDVLKRIKPWNINEKGEVFIKPYPCGETYEEFQIKSQIFDCHTLSKLEKWGATVKVAKIRDFKVLQIENDWVRLENGDRFWTDTENIKIGEPLPQGTIVETKYSTTKEVL